MCKIITVNLYHLQNGLYQTPTVGTEEIKREGVEKMGKVQKRRSLVSETEKRGKKSLNRRGKVESKVTKNSLEVIENGL